jgi:hypothetical protein
MNLRRYSRHQQPADCLFSAQEPALVASRDYLRPHISIEIGQWFDLD